MILVDVGSFGDWFLHLFSQLDEEQSFQVVMLVLAIYFARNQLLWKGRNSIVNLARITLDQWRKAQERSVFLAFDTWYLSNGPELWSKPGYEKLKVNIDVALFVRRKVWFWWGCSGSQGSGCGWDYGTTDWASSSRNC
uniref:Uncharacterized protein n=1 Tax=Cannabis sativa TaxID=3483 RepID=A0A803PQF0_CANSA